jgi:ABC-type amino acid transport substrate-binding protein
VLRAVVLMLLATFVAGAFARGVLSLTIDTRYRSDELLASMKMPHPTLPTVVHPLMPERECPINDRRSVVERIRARGILWVGFVPDSPPYSFFNGKHEFVGFDPDLADRLARELGVGNVEFMPVEWRDVTSALQRCRIDVMMSVPVTLIRLDSVRYSTTYLDTVLAIAVPTAKRHDYATIDRMRRLKSITIGIPPSGRAGHRGFEDLFAGLKVRYVEVESPRAYFEGQLPEVDVLLLRGEVAAAWSLQYPGHTFVVPQPQDRRVPLAVGLRPDDWQLADLVENWLAVQAADGTIDKAREYWMLGRGATDNAPRWSIKRNVLHW